MSTHWPLLEDAQRALVAGRGRGIKVAIVDSGVEVAHPQLAGVHLADDVAIISDDVQLKVEPGGGKDLYGHGTAIAGIIHRLAPEATLGSFRVLDGWLESRTKIIVEGIRLALDRGYNVINCSVGCGVSEHIHDYKAVTDEIYLRRAHLVSACNNDEYTRPEWPGNFTSSITVNMVKTTGDGLFWYKHGNLVEFFASGVGVDVAWRNRGHRNVTGSSYAAPLVSGLVARVLSAMPKLSPSEMKAILQKAATPWTPDLIGPNMRWNS